ncbi:MAG: phosphoribosylformylglycinamidine cyclo-ligase [Pseudomonadota bacterium]
MTNSSSRHPGMGLSYQDAGVDIEAANSLIERIKPAVSRTHRAEVLSSLGGFGALFELPMQRYRNPVLVSGTDGVGTKLKLAQQLGIHRSPGIDLVAMCVNDILVQGAEPLFFLDYFATGKLQVDVAAQVIEGIAEGCKQAGAALIGGETAEMPGMYDPGEYDLAGFCVGVVEKDKLLDGSKVCRGDKLVGLASSGLHSNGFSLVRKILATHNLDPLQRFENSSLAEVLLRPTHIYVPVIMPLLQKGVLKALAHITGGGLSDNLPRVIPQGLNAHIRTATWPRAQIFSWLQKMGQVQEKEMLRTFNCGIGMVAIVAPTELDEVREHCAKQQTKTWVIGEIADGDGTPQVLYD